MEKKEVKAVKRVVEGVVVKFKIVKVDDDNYDNYITIETGTVTKTDKRHGVSYESSVRRMYIVACYAYFTKLMHKKVKLTLEPSTTMFTEKGEPYAIVTKIEVVKEPKVETETNDEDPLAAF